jgi:hypothetical protein
MNTIKSLGSSAMNAASSVGETIKDNKWKTVMTVALVVLLALGITAATGGFGAALAFPLGAGFLGAVCLGGPGLLFASLMDQKDALNIYPTNKFKQPEPFKFDFKTPITEEERAIGAKLSFLRKNRSTAFDKTGTLNTSRHALVDSNG